MGIEINKHRSGRWSNVAFGVCELLDAAVRILSLGFLHTTWVFDYARWQVKREFTKQKLQAAR